MSSTDGLGPEDNGATERGLAAEPTEELLEAARRGDVAAWRRLDARYRRALVAMMHGSIPTSLRSRYDTEDILQSAFLSAFQELDEYRYAGKGSFLRWLVTIFRMRLLDLIREGHALMRDAGKEVDLHVFDGEGAPELASGLRSPQDIAAAAEELARTMELLHELDDEEFLIVARNRFDRKSMQAIALELELPVTTVRRKLARAVGKLRPPLRPGDRPE